MEETKWLTKGKIITIVVIILAIGATVAGILIHKNNVKKDYAKFEKQLEYAAPNYLLKEKIKLKEYEWREINITDIIHFFTTSDSINIKMINISTWCMIFINDCKCRA